MNRREVIQRTAMILGYAITGPALTGVLNGCKADPELTFIPEFFTRDQASLIAALTEIIIPRTDTPGAIDAGVPMFIDRMLKEVYPKESQEIFLKNLAAFDVERVKIMGIIFWPVVIKRKWPTSKKSMMTPFKIVRAQVHQAGGMQV